MHTQGHLIQIYQELADHYGRENKARRRDIFLLLAAYTAWEDGREQEAERFRMRLLHQNPHHMLKPYASFGEALESPDVQHLLEDLQEKYPIEVAQDLLNELWEVPAEPLAPEPPPSAPSASSIPQTEPVIDLDQAEKQSRKRGEPPVIPMPSSGRQRSASPESKQSESRHPPTVLNRDGAAKMEKKRERARTAPPAPQPDDPLDAEIPQTLPLGAMPPEMAPQRRRARPIVEPEPEEEEIEVQSGAWFATLLFLLVLLGGMAALLYVLAEPFLVK